MKRVSVLSLVLMVTTGLVGQTDQQPAVQTMHVSSIHQATDREKTYRTAFGQQFIETTIGSLQYTLEGLTGWAGCNVEIGKDYEVVKANQKGVTIKCPVGKKGKTFNATFNVMTVEEVAKPTVQKPE
jgi:hypothetical protein